MFTSEEVSGPYNDADGTEKYFLAVAALNTANKFASGDKQLVDRVAMLKKKVAGVEMRDDLRGVMQNALSKLEVVQNGI